MRLLYALVLCLVSFAQVMCADLPSLDYKDLDNKIYSFPELYDKGIESIVRIEKYYDSEKDENASAIYQFFFGSTYELQGIATGFVISSDGYILTNDHVVDGGNTFKVTFVNTNHEYTAELIGTDPRTDIAVLKIEKDNLPYLNLDDSDKATIGDWIITLGNPLGYNFSMMLGIIAAKKRQMQYFEIEDFIQVDGSSNFGASGSPLLNTSGKVMGMYSLGLNHMYAENIGFAIPSNIVRIVAKQLITNGKILKKYIGIKFIKNDDDEIKIIDVAKKSPAYKAGLEKDDVILEYNGISVSTYASFYNYISLMEPKDVLNLKIFRKNKKLNKRIVVAEEKTQNF